MDLIVFSHLRWDFVYQRPQHVLSRLGKRGWNVLFVEEPVDGPARVEATPRSAGITVLRTSIPAGGSAMQRQQALCELLQSVWRQRAVRRPVLWFYTPLMLPLAAGLHPAAIVYDCMDELSAFAGADPALPAAEAALLARADLVFTGGQQLYESKRERHRSVHCFPSSVDTAHFAKARESGDEPLDQRSIPRPRLGYFGVIDERFDRDLIDGMAARAPGWSFVLIGPVVKIDPSSLPKRPNIHYLGQKSYEELPSYIATWDVALIPFARNASTRYISPTKVLEYMAAGKPVVSTSIADIVTPYGEQELARIADAPDEAIAAARDAMTEDKTARLEAFDGYLAGTSWDRTVSSMERLIEAAVEGASRTRRADRSAA